MGIYTAGHQPARKIHRLVQCHIRSHRLSARPLFQRSRIRITFRPRPILMYHQQITGLGSHNEPSSEVQGALGSSFGSHPHLEALQTF